jgi:hypothetical protein
MQRNGACEDLTRPKMAMTVGAGPTCSAHAMSEKSSGARLLFFANLKSSSIKCADRNLKKKLTTVRAVALPRADTGATLSTSASPGILCPPLSLPLVPFPCAFRCAFPVPLLFAFPVPFPLTFL